MSEGLAYIDILFFAMVAGFILYRLHSVLGRRTGNEKRRITPIDRAAEAGKAAPPASGEETVAPQPLANAPTSLPRAVETGLAAIRLADPAFDLARFLDGARRAFGMILKAYAEGDRETLRFLCGDAVYEAFERAISERERLGHTMEVELVDIRRADVVEARMDGHRARITVHFVSEQTRVERDAGGRVVDGHPTEVIEVEDIWTFERDVRSEDPNWKLVETRVPA